MSGSFHCWLRFFIALALGLARLHAGAEAPKPIKVFLFAGQSNMVGSDAHRDRIDQFPGFEGAGAPQEDVLFIQLTDPPRAEMAEWGPLAAGESFGPEITFARALKSQNATPFAIIKSAIGGTTVAFDWNPDAPENGQKLYPRTIRLVQQAFGKLEQRGFRPQLEAVMWHQGENDMLDRRLNGQYADGLTRLISRLRTDLRAPGLRWYIGEVSEKGIWGMDNRQNIAILRQQQDQVLQADPLLRWVPTSHLAFDVMGSGQPHYHFGTQGQLQLGRAFAAAYLDKTGKPPGAAERSKKSKLPFRKNSRVRLFVMVGQRNMEGEDSFVARIPDIPGYAALAKPQSGIIQRYSLGGGVKVSPDWESLAPVDFLGNFGPELSLGAHLRKALGVGDGIAIVKFTHSGAQGPDWSPRGAPEAHRTLYPRLIAFIREAKEDLQRRGHECSIEAVYWHAGENDTYFSPYRREYARWMQELIRQVRVDLGQPGMPWFLSEQHPASIWTHVDEMNNALHAVAKSEPSVYIVGTASLPHERVHFGTKGTLLLGEAMAQRYLEAR